MPHNGIDPVPVACQMVQAFQTIISRNKRPIDAGVISVTMIHAGEATNVVPESCELQGTVRTFTVEVLDMIEQRMRRHRPGHLPGVRGRLRVQLSAATTRRPSITRARRSSHASCSTSVVGAHNVQDFEPTHGR